MIYLWFQLVVKNYGNYITTINPYNTIPRPHRNIYREIEKLEKKKLINKFLGITIYYVCLPKSALQYLQRKSMMKKKNCCINFT